MIVFILTMPRNNSWNGRWSGDGYLYTKSMKECQVPKELWEKSFTYSWDDGWMAEIEVRRVPCTEERKLMKKSRGFCGYDWMIKSLIQRGYIISDSDIRRESDG